MQQMKKMLAIICALNSFRNFLYGSAKVDIFTDHQPLTYALSNKNNNSKMKRWKAALEEYSYELFYKPGKQNVVADALSRIPHKETQVNTLSKATNSDDSSSHNLIYSVQAPLFTLSKIKYFLKTTKCPLINSELYFQHTIDMFQSFVTKRLSQTSSDTSTHQ